MTSLELKAHAKINLALDVLRKREDGYHELRMIMQSVGLHDTVYISASGSAVQVGCDSRRVPSGSGNIAFKAAGLMREKYGLKCGLNIRIVKRIPVAAGLAGGSTDAAAVIRGINGLFVLGLDESELMYLGKQVGSDVPYCIRGGTALAEGVGEVLTGLEPFNGVDTVLIRPRIGVSTAWVYSNFDPGMVKSGDRPDMAAICKAAAGRDIAAVAANMKNVLETVTIPRYGIVAEVKKKLLEWGASGSMMSGSGPTVFGLFTGRNTAAGAYREALKDGRWECFLTRTV